MTYQDIYTKFMIEYDKANVTSSYPSLTKYEVATILDKAYLALIALKVTGNNPRRTPFEADIKSIEDLRPLVVTSTLSKSNRTYANRVDNAIDFILPKDMLYYISSFARFNKGGALFKTSPIITIDHNTAYRFYQSSVNMPWIKNPVGYFEEETMTVLYDSWEFKDSASYSIYPVVTYIKSPYGFINALCSSSDTPGGQDDPTITPVVWRITTSYNVQNNLSEDGTDHIYCPTNNATITATCINVATDKPSDVFIEIISGNNYAVVEGNTLIVLNTATSYKKVLIQYTCSENTNYKITDTLYVKYYNNTSTNLNTGKLSDLIIIELGMPMQYAPTPNTLTYTSTVFPAEIIFDLNITPMVASAVEIVSEDSPVLGTFILNKHRLS